MEIFNILCLLTLNYFATDAYMRVERAANCPGITDFPGRVKYRRKGTRAVFKCPKKFDRYGSKFATCQSDGTWSNDPPLCIKTGCVPLDPSQVTNLDMEVVNGALVKFTCLAGYLLIGETQAYCNGKDWSAPLPRCAAPHELTECDFEEDLCGWTQDDDEEQDWIRQMGPTQTGNTGPKHDHTLGDSGNGHYLYFETSNPTMAGHKANLLSPVYTADLSPMCFDFWYHILGPEENGHVGSLEVFILDQSQFIDDDDVQPVFVKEGNQGDMWHRGDIFIDTQPEPYQIAIVATRALSYISDIAFDDVRLYNCTQSTTSTPRTETTPTITTTTSTTSTGSTTTTVKKTVTSSATPVITKTTKTITTTESPTKTTIKTETVTESPTTTTKSTTITESPTSTATKTTTVKPSSSTKKPTPVATSKQTTEATTNTSPNTNTWSSVFTKTTMITPKSTKLSTKTTTTAPTETTEKTKTSKPKTSANTSKSTYASSSSTTSRTVTSASPVSSQTSSKSTVTTSFKTSTATPKSEHKSTVKTSIKSSGTPITTSTKTTTFSERTTESPVKTDASTRNSARSSTSSTVSTRSSSSFSSSSSSSSSSFSSSSSSSTTSSTTRKASAESKTGGNKQQTTSPNYNTKTKVSKDSSEATKTVKPTKRTSALTTKSQKSSNTSIDNSISVSEGRSQHPEDDTLKPLMIGLCVGIVAGLIIIGVIAYVCVRRRKFYTSRYEDELKPITNSASLQSLNNGHYYQDEEYESES